MLEEYAALIVEDWIDAGAELRRLSDTEDLLAADYSFVEDEEGRLLTFEERRALRELVSAGLEAAASPAVEVL
jgi:hypothetical protein